MRSDEVKKGLERAAHRSLLHALGLSSDEIDRPWIGVVNSQSDTVPGHIWLRELSGKVKRAIISSGGTPFEFDSIAICDGLCQGHVGMKYVLPSREVICDSVEAMVESQRLDGLVLISSCDKIIPGHLMAAARIDIPSIVLTGGPMMPGEYKGRKLTLVDMREFIGRVQAGELTMEELSEIEQVACPGPGSCAMMGTANTMAIAAEAMGMALPGTASAHAGSLVKSELAEAAGKQIMRLVRRAVTPRRIITKSSLENAIRVIMAVGGSLNAVLHILAIAREAGIEITIDDFDRISSATPQLCSVKPSGEHTMQDFDQAGGVPAVMRQLSKLLELESLTVSLMTVGQLIESHRVRRKDVIRSVSTSYRPEGGIAILRGNLAPKGALIKTSALTKEMLSGRAQAKVFEGLEDALSWIRDRRIERPTCIVIRYEGPKGGPGMREMHMITSLIVGRGLATQVFLVTDGRFSGSTRGPFIGHVCPEAYEGGPIALVRDGDLVSYDVVSKRLMVQVAAEEFADRRRAWKRPEKPVRGLLARYRDLALGADQGAGMASCGL